MKYLFTLFVCFFTSVVLSNDIYKIKVNLISINNDKLFIEINTPDIIEKEILFVFAKVIPGTYCIDNYGRFIENFKAYGEDNVSLKIETHDVNSYKIYNANRIRKITYEVRDTWDDNNNKNDFVFQPSGTNFSEGKNFVLNNHALFGYFENYENIKYEIEFTRPDFFYPSTSLELVNSKKGKDYFIANNYSELIDNPIMYCIPDTISYSEGETKIVISVYSDVGSVSSNMIIDKLKPITNAVTSIFGPLPLKEYKFIYYFFSEENTKQKQISYGALEHKHCSFYYIYSGLGSNIDSVSLFRDIIEMSSHEFMHIFTPLKLRSNKIADFNYYKPNMSKHLWLYEGVTEYLSLKVLLKSGLMDVTEFTNILRTKITIAEKYKKFPLTTISQRILEPKYQNQFDNIYDKGALIAFILDIELSKPSNGSIGLVGLFKKLLDKYKNMPFEDNMFIDEIKDMTDSEVDSIFIKYITGVVPIDYNKYFKSVGLTYYPVKKIDTYSFGRFKIIQYISLSDPLKNRYLIKPIGNSRFGRKKFYSIKINGKRTTMDLLYKFLRSPKNISVVNFEIERNKNIEKIKLQPTIIKKNEIKHYIEVNNELKEIEKNKYKNIFMN